MVGRHLRCRGMGSHPLLVSRVRLLFLRERRTHRLDAPTGAASMTVRSNAQQEQTALRFLRQARDSGLTDDDDIIAEAARLMGREHLPLIGRVFGRHFKVHGGAG